MKKKDTQKVALVNCITDIINTVNVSKKPAKEINKYSNTSNVVSSLATSNVVSSSAKSLNVVSSSAKSLNFDPNIHEKYENGIGIEENEDLIKIINKSYQINDETINNCYLLGEGMFGKTYFNENAKKSFYALKVILKNQQQDKKYYNGCFDELVVVKKIQEYWKNEITDKKKLNIMNIEKWMFVDDANNNKPLVSFIMDKYEFSLNDLMKAFYFTVNPTQYKYLLNQRGGKITFNNQADNITDNNNNSCKKDNNNGQLDQLIKKVENYFILNTKIQTLKIRRLCDTIMKQIATGLKQIHASGFIHFDIKPDNIMINGLLNNEENFNEYLKKIHVYIIDFGLAQYIGNSENIKINSEIGTPLYLPPESFNETDNNYTLSKKVDIYSFGKTCFYLYNGIIRIKTQYFQYSLPINQKYKWEEANDIKEITDPTYYDNMKTFMKSVSNDTTNFFSFDENLKDEILKCLNENPTERPSAEDLESFFSIPYNLSIADFSVIK
jgi:serine/threonine protein kinase